MVWHANVVHNIPRFLQLLVLLSHIFTIALSDSTHRLPPTLLYSIITVCDLLSAPIYVLATLIANLVYAPYQCFLIPIFFPILPIPLLHSQLHTSYIFILVCLYICVALSVLLTLLYFLL